MMPPENDPNHSLSVTRLQYEAELKQWWQAEDHARQRRYSLQQSLGHTKDKKKRIASERDTVMTPPVVLSELDDTLREMRLRGADKATGVRWEAYQALLDESRRLHAAMAAGDEVLPASVEQMYLNAIGQNKAASMRQQIMGGPAQGQMSRAGDGWAGGGVVTTTGSTTEFTSTQKVGNAPRTSAVLWLDQEVGRVRAKGRTALSTL